MQFESPSSIISVTGTKGKTTVVNVLAQILQKLGKNTLQVDTTGCFVNGSRTVTSDESMQVWRLMPTVCPGRFLWEFHANPELQQNGVAVLECSIGCSRAPGLGYYMHKVGVFLNVYEDHLGASKRLQNRQDIAEAKSFIFENIKRNGYAVFNAEDSYVCSQLYKISPNFAVQLIPCGTDFKEFDLETHLKNSGVAITLKGADVVLRSLEGDRVLFSLAAIPWAFKGAFKPSVDNLLHIAGALWGYFDGNLPEGFREAVESVRLDPYGGRLTLLRSKSGTTILADYAHEKVSLREVAKLAHTLIDKDSRVIGVVRLAHDRTDQQLAETGHIIAENYDELVVYDKIDGFWRKENPIRALTWPQIEGRTSQVLTDAIREKNPNVTRIVREDEALEYAAKLAKPNDIVVAIVNDDIERSIAFIREKFDANFI